MMSDAGTRGRDVSACSQLRDNERCAHRMTVCECSSRLLGDASRNPDARHQEVDPQRAFRGPALHQEPLAE